MRGVSIFGRHNPRRRQGAEKADPVKPGMGPGNEAGRDRDSHGTKQCDDDKLDAELHPRPFLIVRLPLQGPDNVNDAFRTKALHET